jgi:hypothetical protein
LKNRFIKVASKKGIPDLEFGISGELWRIRAEEFVSFKIPSFSPKP